MSIIYALVLVFGVFFTGNAQAITVTPHDVLDDDITPGEIQYKVNNEFHTLRNFPEIWKQIRHDTIMGDPVSEGFAAILAHTNPDSTDCVTGEGCSNSWTMSTTTKYIKEEQRLEEMHRKIDKAERYTMLMADSLGAYNNYDFMGPKDIEGGGAMDFTMHPDILRTFIDIDYLWFETKQGASIGGPDTPEADDAEFGQLRGVHACRADCVPGCDATPDPYNYYYKECCYPTALDVPYFAEIETPSAEVNILYPYNINQDEQARSCGYGGGRGEVGLASSCNEKHYKTSCNDVFYQPGRKSPISYTTESNCIGCLMWWTINKQKEWVSNKKYTGDAPQVKGSTASPDLIQSNPITVPGALTQLSEYSLIALCIPKYLFENPVLNGVIDMQCPPPNPIQQPAYNKNQSWLVDLFKNYGRKTADGRVIGRIGQQYFGMITGIVNRAECEATVLYTPLLGAGNITEKIALCRQSAKQLEEYQFSQMGKSPERQGSGNSHRYVFPAYEMLFYDLLGIHKNIGEIQKIITCADDSKCRMDQIL